MTFFLKELVSHNPIALSSGAVLNWELVGNDTGVLATEDEGVTKELQALIKQRRGGVIELSAEKYEAQKKNTNFVKKMPPSVIDAPLKLVDRNINPLKAAQPATAPAAAKVAEGKSLAPAAAVPAAPVPAVKKTPVSLKTKRPSVPAPALAG